MSGFADDGAHDAVGLADLVRRGKALFNLTDQPAVVRPRGATPEGLPLAVQIVGRHGDEATLFRLASPLERARPWIERRPPVAR